MFGAFNRLSIGRRLSLIVITITTLTLIAVVYVTLVSTTGTIRAERSRALVEQSEATSFRIDDRVSRVSQYLNAINGRIESGDPDQLLVSDVQAAVEAIMRFEINLVVRRIVIYIPDQQVTLVNFIDVSSGRNILVNNISHNRVEPSMWFVQALERDSYGWHGPEPSPFVDQNDTVVSYAIPIRLSNGGQTEGVLWAEVSVTTVENLLRESSLFERIVTRDSNAYNFIVTPAGEFVARFNARQRPLDQLKEVLDNVPTPNALAFHTLYLEPGTPTYTINTPMGLTGWRMITVIEDDILPGLPATTVAQVLLFSGLGLLAVSFTVGYFISRSLTVPLMELSTAAADIGSGDMRRMIRYQSLEDEVGQLARTLDDMRNNLRYSYDTLEQRIQRRTAELEIARMKAQSTAEDLGAVYNESISVVSEYQLQALLNAFTERIMKLLRADFCAVWLMRDSADELRAVAHTLPTPLDQVPFVPLGKGLVGMTSQTGKPIILDHYSTWENRLANVFYADGVERAMCVPMMSSGKAIGAVLIGRYGLSAETFDENQQRLLELFANMVSPSVRNAQLYVQLDDARHEADRANIVKTRFLASVTHELRTPLNLIINNMDFMRIGAFGEITEEQDNRLRQTIRSAEHLLYLINDLLDVSKIDAGEMQLFVQPTDVYTVIEDVVDSAMMQLDKDDKADVLTLRVDMDENLPPVPMDARRIRQVLHNLLSNAIKFTLQGEVRLDVKLEDNRLRCSVTDTGIGIPEGEHDALFAPFERVSNAKNMGIEGTGLGLPISKYLVEQHGGQLTFKTLMGKGTTFSFDLPVDHAFEQKHITSTQTVTLTDSGDTRPVD